MPNGVRIPSFVIGEQYLSGYPRHLIPGGHFSARAGRWTQGDAPNRAVVA
jgi:hypothetical protein